MATEILPESNGDTVPLRLITCSGGSAAAAARDSGRS
jgi:hypothetical protein